MRKTLILTAAGGSAGLLILALGFQYLGGLAPCPLCIWQRWPHLIAAVIGAGAWGLGGTLLPGTGAATMTVSAGMGMHHVGVEQGWWEGPATCAAPDISGLTPEELLAQIMAAPIVRCDEIAWELFGVSMAGWNALASLALAGLWLAAVRAR